MLLIVLASDSIQLLNLMLGIYIDDQADQINFIAGEHALYYYNIDQVSVTWLNIISRTRPDKLLTVILWKAET